ncbi:hypothetical protein M885DRAFT_215953 [Pelagophyceae sp. CCMP2097]|nr:hypothetical protein M885DRAFT_215953 [Pelagophyceae sp. CCMP2097]
MIKVVKAFDKMNQKRAAAKKPLPPLYVSGVEALRGRQRRQTSLFEARRITGTRKSQIMPDDVCRQVAQGLAAREALRRRVLRRRRLPAPAERPEEAVVALREAHEDRAVGAASRGRGRRRRAGAGPDVARRAPRDPALEPLARRARARRGAFRMNLSTEGLVESS